MSSFDLNKAMLIGNVGKRPLQREFGDNKKLVKFTVATNNSWKNKQTGEYETQTQWHNIVCFNQFLCGVIMDHVTVGSKIYLEGESQTRMYRQEGKDYDQYITEIVIPAFSGDIKVLSRGKEGAEQPTGDVAGEPTGADPDPFEDDIPFK